MDGYYRSDPDTLVNTGMGISPLLHPDDAHKFKEASDKLQSDDSHTVEIQFRMRVEPDYDDADQMENVEPVYLDMEGSGMLMLDRVEQVPSHTMWVIKPGPETPSEEENELLLPEPAAGLTGRTPTTPFRFPLNKAPTADNLPVIKSLSATPILCRICENQIPSWFFEKHNETCNEVHKFEADIAECNESISEMRNTVRELISGIEKLGLNIEKAIPERPPLEYRGMSISTPQTTTTTNSPIQVFRPPLASRMQRVGVRKAQQKLLEQMEEILTLAGEISVPGLKEEESKEPIERQRLLSPNSEDRIGKCMTWVKPAPEDPALLRLVQDVDYLIKQKLDTVMRMQNTVRYEEKIRQEWLLKYEEAVAVASVMETSVINDTVLEEPSESALQDEEDDGASSTTSEYDFGRGKTSTEPTPVASSPAPPTTPLPLVPVMPVPVPATYQGVGAHKHSRSSTPSSVTSPLAIAAPINAATTPEASLVDRAALLAAVEDSTQTIRARRTSMQNVGTPGSVMLEPKLLVTPPVSPSLGSLGIATGGHSRRLSIAQPILSPTVAVAPGPHHGRLPSVAPSKAAPSSIKDFEIIKPISKGAFGSVFLAKKKTTGDYFAIKVLKKSDMIAKNQVTNVKAERMILMKQAESPFVVKLYFTFQSKDNLYLVMEYLNGGDCAALIKTLGSLPEEWTRAYVAEVVLGLEFLHGKGIVHRYVAHVYDGLC
jgi:serine/threonine-protein kinase RIM15